MEEYTERHTEEYTEGEVHIDGHTRKDTLRDK